MTKLSEEDYKKNREVISKHRKKTKLYNLVKTILVTLNVIIITFLASMTSIGVEEVYDLHEDAFILSLIRFIIYPALIYASYQFWKQINLSRRLKNIIIYNNKK